MESFSILSGAGLLDASEEKPMYVHTTSKVEIKQTNTIEIPDEYVCWNKTITYGEGVEPAKDKDGNVLCEHNAAEIFIMNLKDGEVDTEPCIPVEVEHIFENGSKKTRITCYSHDGVLNKGTIVMVDYYILRTGGAQTIEIDAEKFGGNYYLEASTLWRRRSDGVDMPAEFIIPNCKVQSNFTFNLASSGDPSTFTFTMDAFPDYTKFDQTKKVLAAIQVIYDESGETEGTREPCAEKLDSYSNDIDVEFVKNTREIAEVEVNGACSGKDYDSALFGDSVAKGSELILTFPIEPDAHMQYSVVQTNPGLTNFASDPNITGTVKTKTYTGKDLEDGYGLLLTEESAQTVGEPDETKNITVEITGGNNFHKTYTIKNYVDFGTTTVSGKTYKPAYSPATDDE